MKLWLWSQGIKIQASKIMTTGSDGVKSQGLKITSELEVQFWSNKDWTFCQHLSQGITFNGQWNHDSGVGWSQESRFKNDSRVNGRIRTQISSWFWNPMVEVAVKFNRDSGIKLESVSFFCWLLVPALNCNPFTCRAGDSYLGVSVSIM